MLKTVASSQTDASTLDTVKAVGVYVWITWIPIALLSASATRECPDDVVFYYQQMG